MLLIVDVVLIVLIALVLWVASRRGRAQARRARALRAARPTSDLADLIPGRPAVVAEVEPATRAIPTVAPPRATWSASFERGETTAPVISPPEPDETLRPEPERTRPAVVVAPRGPSWVVRRDGASRVSSVHGSRDAAVARGQKTARRERVVFEVRDEGAAVLDRTDFSAGQSSTTESGS